MSLYCLKCSHPHVAFLHTFMVPADYDGVVSGAYYIEGKGSMNSKYYMILKKTGDTSIEIVYSLVN